MAALYWSQPKIPTKNSHAKIGLPDQAGAMLQGICGNNPPKERRTTTALPQYGDISQSRPSNVNGQI
jgi:hypothetical protein